VDDHEEIRQVLGLYVEIMDKARPENISRAFAPGALFMSVSREGTLRQMALDEWWGRIEGASGKRAREHTITVLDISGLAAAAKVDFATSQDFMTLLKLGGEWKIVNKVLSTSL
jgi:hypothetical protein